MHPNISPGDITYLVTTPPQHGYLEIQSITSDDEYNCAVFDQSTINSEKMFYIQAGVNQSVDHFVFDVTNGITWLHGLSLKIVIIPENLYIQTRNISVEEGSYTPFLIVNPELIRLSPSHRKNLEIGTNRFRAIFGLLSREDFRISHPAAAHIRRYQIRCIESESIHAQTTGIGHHSLRPRWQRECDRLFAYGRCRSEQGEHPI